MILALLLALQAPLAARPDTIRPVHDALHHDITMVVGDTGMHIVGIVQTAWRLGSSDPVEVALDSAFRVVRVLTDGKGESRMGRITFALIAGGGVHIPHKKAAGDTIRTSIRYHGPVRDGLIIRTDSSGRRTVFADNWPDRAHRWLPLVDHPSDKATVALHIEVPPGVRVIGIGVLEKVDTLPRGRRVWHFRMRQSITPYGIVFGAGPLTVTPLGDAACAVRCVPVEVIAFAEDSAWAAAGPFRRAREIVEYFSQLVGPFPYDRLAHVQSSTIFGGAENPSAIFYNERAYPKRTLSEETVAHETAHQWFGDAVTEADWHHLWLSEGFATYYGALWTRHADGDSAFRAMMAGNAVEVIGSEATSRPILDPAATDLMGLLNSNNYPKGAWVLHSLRGLIGDSAYHAGVREWYRTYRDSTALSSDFARVMSTAAGTDLTWYFMQALTQPGYPRLDVRWSRKGGTVRVTVRQVQPEAWGLFRLPNLVLAMDGRRVPVLVDGRETTVTVDGIRGPPKQVVVDPDGWWLLEATVVQER